MQSPEHRNQQRTPTAGESSKEDRELERIGAALERIGGVMERLGFWVKVVVITGLAYVALTLLDAILRTVFF